MGCQNKPLLAKYIIWEKTSVSSFSTKTYLSSKPTNCLFTQLKCNLRIIIGFALDVPNQIQTKVNLSLIQILNAQIKFDLIQVGVQY